MKKEIRKIVNVSLNLCIQNIRLEINMSVILVRLNNRINYNGIGINTMKCMVLHVLK